jgi:uncharacterized membrane protein YqjE
MDLPKAEPKSPVKSKRLYLIAGIALVFISFILFSLKLTVSIFGRHMGYGFLTFILAIGLIYKSYDD